MGSERIISFAIGISILAYLFSKIDFVKTGALVLSMPFGYVLAFFLVMAFAIALKGLKWKLSLRIFSIPVGFLKAAEMWIIGFSIGAVTPGRVGDFVKIAYVDAKKSKSLGAVFLDRLTDVFAVAFFALLGFGIFGEAIGAAKQALYFSFAAAIVCAIIAIKYYRNVFRIFLGTIVPEKYRAAMVSGASDFFQSSKEAIRRRKSILAVAAMSAGIWMISGLQFLILARALSINIDYFPLLFIMSIVAIVELIPITVAGLGTREATIVFLMSFLGVGSEKAIAFSLTNFVFGYVVLTSLGYIFWLRNPITQKPPKPI